jgi:hypothetical protein
VPFIKGLAEKIKREVRKKGIYVVFGKRKTLKSSLYKLKQSYQRSRPKTASI